MLPEALPNQYESDVSFWDSDHPDEKFKEDKKKAEEEQKRKE